MACNSDYMSASFKERHLQQTAQHLVYARKKLGLNVTPKLQSVATDCYAAKDYTAELCALINGLGAAAFNLVVYDARNKASRALADWWEQHEEADRKRVEAETNAKEDARLVKSGLAKLTAKEKQAILKSK